SIPFSPGNANSAKEALAKISVVRGDIAAKRLTFDQAIEKFGYKNSSATSGTFDRIPLPSLENSEASELKDLSIDEVSPVITGNDFVSIVKLIKIYPMSSENYEPINERLKMEAATKARIDYFKSLRQKYSGFVIIQK
ncbi:MAG: hypothetical protein NTY22_00935, partial [Proteobacteria bacterium]|nr:hypothetical protein [Pseudomonadota bacterium]